MIVFDLQALQSTAHAERGIGRYVFDLAATMIAGHPGVVDVFAWNDALPRTPGIDGVGALLDDPDRLAAYSALAGTEVDVLHVNSPFEMDDYRRVAVPVAARRLIVTCYDLIPYRFADHYLADPSTSARYRTRLGLLATADAIVADSRSAADDLVELLELDRRRVTVIGAGTSPQFAPPAVPERDVLAVVQQALPEVRAGFVLVPAGTDWRKNAVGAIEAYAELAAPLRGRHQLVVACSLDPAGRRWLTHVAERSGVLDRVVFTDHVGDATLVALYQSAELVVFPSFYEGFGLPVLEARRCGARVISSVTSSMPEILADPIAWFDPWDRTAIVERMTAALTDVSYAAALDAIPDPGYSWESTARRLVDVYRRQLTLAAGASPVAAASS